MPDRQLQMQALFVPEIHHEGVKQLSRSSPSILSSALHAKPSRSSRPVTRATPQKSSAKTPNLSHVPCKFFKQGACTAGANCFFSHSQEMTAEAAVCKYFLKGNCKFGSKCALLHPPSPPDNRKSNGNIAGSTGDGSTGKAVPFKNAPGTRPHPQQQEQSTRLDPNMVAGLPRGYSRMDNGSQSNYSSHESDPSKGRNSQLTSALLQSSTTATSLSSQQEQPQQHSYGIGGMRVSSSVGGFASTSVGQLQASSFGAFANHSYQPAGAAFSPPLLSSLYDLLSPSDVAVRERRQGLLPKHSPGSGWDSIWERSSQSYRSPLVRSPHDSQVLSPFSSSWNVYRTPAQDNSLSEIWADMEPENTTPPSQTPMVSVPPETSSHSAITQAINIPGDSSKYYHRSFYTSHQGIPSVGSAQDEGGLSSFFGNTTHVASSHDDHDSDPFSSFPHHPPQDVGYSADDDFEFFMQDHDQPSQERHTVLPSLCS